MNETLREYLRDFTVVYLDDIIVYSRTFKKHQIHVRKVLQKIREAGLKLKPSKYQWFKQELTFVGHKVSVDEIQPDK